MVLDPLSAFAVACNVLQVAEVGVRTLARAAEYRGAANGALRDQNDLRGILQNLEGLSTDLQTKLSNEATGPSQDAAGSRLGHANEECLRLSREFIALLDRLKIKDQKTMLESLRMSLRSLWYKEKLAAMGKAITQARDNLNVALLMYIQSQQASLPTRTDLTNTFTTTQQRIIDAFNLSSTSLKRDITDLTARVDNLRFDSYQHIASDFVQSHESLFEQISAKLDIILLSTKSDTIQDDKTTQKINNTLLKSLYYPRMRERLEQVQIAHGNTYHWILEPPRVPCQTSWDGDAIHVPGSAKELPESHFEPSRAHYLEDGANRKLKFLHKRKPILRRSVSTNYDPNGAGPAVVQLEDPRLGRSHPWDSFRSWVGSNTSHSGIYWVNGKIGSGKSTLMRYLDANINQAQHMSPWADGCPVIKAQYFFWNPAASVLQKSYTGLLRALLFQLFEHTPHLIASSVDTSKWRSAQTLDQSLLEWSRFELQETIQLYVKNSTLSHKILLIIDGMDEAVETGEERDEFLRFIIGLSENENVKICISSRPWTVFQDAFHGYSTLRLEQLTFPDIQAFVTETLGSHPRFKYICRLDPEGAGLLTTRIIEKAEGVFLWARLVVREQLQSLREGGGAKELLGILHATPADLDEHFRKLLDSIPALHRKEASMLFQIALHREDYFSAANPLRLLDLSFIDEAETDFALSWIPGRDTFKPHDRESMMFRLDSTLRKLDSRCLGLLECSYDPGRTVNLLNLAEELYEPAHASSDWELDGDDYTSMHPLVQKIAKTRLQKLFAFDFGVNFLHRSLYDFLMAGDGHKILLQHTDGEFDARRYLRNARIAQIQELQSAKFCVPLATGLCSYVLSTLAIPGYRSRPISAELALRIKSSVEQIATEPEWAPSYWYLDSSLTSWRWEKSNFLTVAIDFGLKSYVRQHMNPNAIQAKRGRPILDHLLRPRFAGDFEHFGIGNQSPWLEMVRYVLANGGDPNQEWQGASTWARFLRFTASTVREAPPPEVQAQHYFAALVLMIEHGAARVLPCSWLLGTGVYRKYSDELPEDESNAEQWLARWWGKSISAIGQDETGEYLYEVKSLVECLTPELLDRRDVEHLKMLLGDSRFRDSRYLPSRIVHPNT